jgi:ribonuclease III
MDNRLIYDIEVALGVFFHDKALLVNALTTRSYAKEALEKDPSLKVLDNERLEFLGDAVLELVVRNYLYTHMSECESVLSCLADDYVNEEYLYQVARRLRLHEYVRMGLGERNQDPQNLLVGALEAIIAAVYLDAGLLRVINFILEQVILSK